MDLKRKEPWRIPLSLSVCLILNQQFKYIAVCLTILAVLPRTSLSQTRHLNNFKNTKSKTLTYNIKTDPLIRVKVPKLTAKLSSVKAVTVAAIAPIYTNCDLVYNYAWNTAIAHGICMAESQNNPSAHNGNAYTGDNSYGLFQINIYGSLAYTRPSAAQLLDPNFNVAYAYQLYVADGWYPWSTYKTGAYERYL